MRLLRTIRLDRSDTFVFDAAAEPGEWASPGSFTFWDEDPTEMTGKRRAAFRSGFLGLRSFGWSTLVEVAEASQSDIAVLRRGLAEHLKAVHGAPDDVSALGAADDEIAFAAGLADHPVGTVIALQRSVEADGSVRERFRTIKTTLEPGQNTFAQGCIQPIGIAHDDGGAEGVPAVEEIDFVGLMGGVAPGVPPSGGEPT